MQNLFLIQKKRISKIEEKMCKLNKRLHDDTIIAVHFLFFVIIKGAFDLKGGEGAPNLRSVGRVGHITL